MRAGTEAGDTQPQAKEGQSHRSLEIGRESSPLELAVTATLPTL